MDNLFLLQLYLCDLFVKIEDAPCYARPIHGKSALVLGQLQLAQSLSCDDLTFASLNLCNSKAAPYFSTPRRAQPLSAFPVVYVKRSCELKLSQHESTFSVNRSHVSLRVFIVDEQIAKTKLK